MIINYSICNFRSFRNPSKLTLQATSQTTFNDNLIRNNGLRILPSAIIYGANASGKSNIISSISILREIVIAGSISTNYFHDLELYPFAHCNEIGPICFDIEFINNKRHMRYRLNINVGCFEKIQRSIEFESLDLYTSKNKTINLFTREKNEIFLPSDEKAKSLIGLENDTISVIIDKLNLNLDPVELFLARGFKSFINSDYADTVIDFFSNKLYVITDFTLKSASIKITSDSKINPNFSMWNDLLEGFVKGADFGPQKIRFLSKESSDDHSADMELFSIYPYKDSTIRVPAQLMESRGTLKLIDFAIAFQSFFKDGCSFIFDEFDAALHPELVKGIISVFHNQEINANGSQLIFSTHNPIYLNNKIFRRDQILFTEKDKNSFESTLYSLADFGSVDVRNDENYLINYFKGKYSSLPYIDFAKILSLKKEGEN